MTEGVAVSPSVVAFVAERIESLEQLELLVLVMESSERWWDAAGVAAALSIETEAARRALDRLAARNLLAICVTGDVRYQFQPAGDQLRRSVTSFRHAWRSNRLGILKLVSRQAPSSIRDFAKAFRIRRDGDT